MAIDLNQFDRADLELRLLRHLPADWGTGCLFTSGLWLDKDECPILCVGGHRLRVNRVAFHVWCGPIPPGALVLHRCDRPPSTEPAAITPVRPVRRGTMRWTGSDPSAVEFGGDGDDRLGGRG